MSESNAMLAGVVVLFWLAARLALGVWPAAALAVLPIAFLLPWNAPWRAAQPDRMLALASASVLVAWLALRQPGRIAALRQERITMIIIAGMAAGCAILAPSSWLLCAVMAIDIGRQPQFARRYGPVQLVAAGWAVAAVLTAMAAPPEMLGRFDFWWETFAAGGWRMGGVYEAIRPAHVLEIQAGVDRYFWWPVAVCAAAMAAVLRDRWWVGPVMLWGMVMTAGVLLIGRDTRLHLNIVLQAAILVPLGIVGMERLLSTMRAPGNAAPAPGKPKRRN